MSTKQKRLILAEKRKNAYRSVRSFNKQLINEGRFDLLVPLLLIDNDNPDKKHATLVRDQVEQQLKREGRTDLLAMIERIKYTKDLDEDSIRYERTLRETTDMLEFIVTSRAQGTTRKTTSELLEIFIKENEHRMLEMMTIEEFRDHLKERKMGRDLERLRVDLLLEWEKQKRIQELEQLEFEQDQAGLWDVDE